MHIKSLATIIVVGALATAVSTKHAFATQNFLEPTFWPGNSRVEGPVFFAHINDPGNGAVRMWEFYNTISEEYFYTTSEAERASIPVESPGIHIDFKGWITSGTEYWTWPGPGPDLAALYRSFNGREHLYSLNETEGPGEGFTPQEIQTFVLTAPVNAATQIYRWIQG